MRWMRPVLVAVLFGLLTSCQKGEVQQQTPTGWDLAVLHKTPLQTFEVSGNGALLYTIHREIQHKIVDHQEVVLLRDHRSGIDNGMSEVLFSVESFKPLYVQRYFEVDGALNEIRLDYRGDEVRLQKTASLFGGEMVDRMVDLPDTCYDSLQIPALLRSRFWTKGDTVNWLVFNSEKSSVDTLHVQAQAPVTVKVKAGQFMALPLNISVGAEMSTWYLEQESPRRILLIEESLGRRTEWID